MKYTIDKKLKALIKEELEICANIALQIKLRKTFPVDVNVEGNYLVIESKINYDAPL